MIKEILKKKTNQTIDKKSRSSSNDKIIHILPNLIKYTYCFKYCNHYIKYLSFEEFLTYHMTIVIEEYCFDNVYIHTSL